LKDDLEISRSQLVKKQEYIHRLKKEHEKLAKQRDLVHSKLISGEKQMTEPTRRIAPRNLLAGPPGSARKEPKVNSPSFLTSLYSSPPVKTSSMMNVISKTAPAKSRNVKVE
jgi:hypothetical protein